MPLQDACVNLELDLRPSTIRKNIVLNTTYGNFDFYCDWIGTIYFLTVACILEIKVFINMREKSLNYCN